MLRVHANCPKLLRDSAPSTHIPVVSGTHRPLCYHAKILPLMESTQTVLYSWHLKTKFGENYNRCVSVLHDICVRLKARL